MPGSDDETREVARLPAVSLFILVAVLQITLGATAQLSNVPLGLLYTELLVFGVPAILVLFGSNLRLDFLRPRPPDLKLVGLVALLGVANFPLAGGIASVTRALSDQLLAALDPAGGGARALRWMIAQSEIGERVLSTQFGVWRALVIVAACIAAPLCEELAFRGVIQPAFAARWGTARGVMAAAALFSLMHMNPILTPALFELGLVFGLVVVATRSLAASVLLHAIHNSLTAAILYGGVEESLDPNDLGSALLMVGVGLVVTAPIAWSLAGATRGKAQAVPAPERREPEAPVRFRPARVWRGSVVWAGALAAALGALLWASSPRPSAPRPAPGIEEKSP